MKLISERPQGTLLANTELNTREQVNAIILRSGKELPRVQERKKEVEENIDETKKKNRVAEDQEKLEEVQRIK